MTRRIRLAARGDSGRSCQIAFLLKDFDIIFHSLGRLREGFVVCGRSITLGGGIGGCSTDSIEFQTLSGLQTFNIKQINQLCRRIIPLG